METFKWLTQTVDSSDYKFNTQTVSFGDGYTQEAELDLNAEVDSWPLTFIGKKAGIGGEILAFLRTHRQVEPFYWINPTGEMGIYKATSLKLALPASDVYSISVTFTRWFP